jgi:hypothetical protein
MGALKLHPKQLPKLYRGVTEKFHTAPGALFHSPNPPPTRESTYHIIQTFFPLTSKIPYKMEVLSISPEASSFVPLAEHQSRTPSSFYSGPPVLYHHSQRCKIVILERELLANPALNALRGDNAANSITSQGQQDSDEKEVAITDVDTWVTSE